MSAVWVLLIVIVYNCISCFICNRNLQLPWLGFVTRLIIHGRRLMFNLNADTT